MKVLKDLKIEICPPGEYSRQVISRGRYKPTFKVPGRKPGTTQPAESLLEAAGLTLLHADPTVLSLRAQAAILTMTIEVRGLLTVRTHLPDALAERPHSRTFVEFKYKDRAAAPEVKERTEVLMEAVPQHGFQYVLMTEDDIYEPKEKLENARFILRHGGRQVLSTLERERIRRVFVSRPEIQWGEVLRGSLGPKGPYQVCRLILDGFLDFDRMAPLSSRTSIRDRKSVV